MEIDYKMITQRKKGRKSANRIFSLSLGVIFLLYSCGCATYLVHPDFKERQKSIHSFAVMPPEVSVYKLTFKGDRLTMYDLIPVVERYTIEEIKKIFIEKNYEFRELNLSKDVLAKNLKLKTALFNVNKLFNKALNDIQKRKKKEFTYTLGWEVNRFADISNSDILIFVKVEGFKKTGGEIAKDFLKSILIGVATLGSAFVIYYPSVTLVRVAVVDSNNGNILWYNHNIGYHNVDCVNEKAFRRVIRFILRPFPKRK
jgi:hypothetical protein